MITAGVVDGAEAAVEGELAGRDGAVEAGEVDAEGAALLPLRVTATLGSSAPRADAIPAVAE